MNTLQLFIVYLPLPSSPLLYHPSPPLESMPPNCEVIQVYYLRVLSENFTKFKLLLKKFWKSTCLFLESPVIY